MCTLSQYITEFDVVDLSPKGHRWSAATTTEVTLPYNTPVEGSFAFISYCVIILCHFYILDKFVFITVFYLLRSQCMNTLVIQDNINQNNIIMQFKRHHNGIMISSLGPLWCQNANPLFCDDFGMLPLFRKWRC